jgi:8-oxo-dGTP diphosphatase
MRDRPSLRPPATGRRASYTIDVVTFSPQGRSLAVLSTPTAPRARDRRTLPFGLPLANESLEHCARRLVRELLDATPAWIEQVGAFADGRRHVTNAELSIAFMAVMPSTPVPPGSPAEWLGPGELTSLAPRQRTMAETALASLRNRMDHAPIAFHLLPERFTLSELQGTYEILLGRRLHKASFRRALQAAFLVEPTDEWRAEGRGRPAQFFSFAPRKRRGARRGVRFDAIV